MKKKVTAMELAARLREDAHFIASRAREEQERQEKAEEWRRAERPLVAALRAVGFEVRSVWDLVNSSQPYPAALPILLNHLQRSYPAAVREGIARALAVRPARFGWDVFVRLYQAEQDGRVKDGLAVAIAASANDDVVHEVIQLARNQQNGPSIEKLLSALVRSKDPRARAALTDLTVDPELQKEIKIILSKMKHK